MLQIVLCMRNRPASIHHGLVIDSLATLGSKPGILPKRYSPVRLQTPPGATPPFAGGRASPSLRHG